MPIQIFPYRLLAILYFSMHLILPKILHQLKVPMYRKWSRFGNDSGHCLWLWVSRLNRGKYRQAATLHPLLWQYKTEFLVWGTRIQDSEEFLTKCFQTVIIQVANYDYDLGRIIGITFSVRPELHGKLIE